MSTIRESWKAKAAGTIRDVDISSAGGYTVAGSFDRHVYFYDKQGKLLWKYETGDSARDVALSFNGKYVAVGSYDHKVYLFSREGRLLWDYETGGEIRDLAISAEGNYIAAASNDHHIYFFSKEGRLLWKYKMKDKAVCLCMSLRADYIAAGSFDDHVYFFNREGRLLWKFRTLSPVVDVEMSSKGRYVAVGSHDRNLYYLNTEGELLWKYHGLFPTDKVAISPNGEFVAIGIEGSVLYFNREGTLLWEKGVGEFEVTGLEFSVFGESVIVGTQGGQLLFFDRRGRNLWKYQTPSPVEKANISANGRYIVAGHTGGELLFFDTLDFFKWVFNNARESVQLLHNYGIEAPEITEQITDSKNFFENKQYLDSLHAALRAKLMAKEAVKTHTPELAVEMLFDTKLSYHEWSPVVFEIENMGKALAFDLRLELKGDVMVRGDRSALRHKALAIYEKTRLKLDIKPLVTKNLPIFIQLDYINFGGRKFSQTLKTNFYVYPPERLDGIQYEKTSKVEEKLMKKQRSLLSQKGEGLVRDRDHRKEAAQALPRGERLIFRCPSCNKEIKQEWVACPFCGTLLKGRTASDRSGMDR